MSKLLPNLPIENLTPENDYIGIIEKGTLLKSFFLNNKHEFAKIKIFSIYGEWGSGKSTLMKYLQKELTGSFNTFFFESWEFESDNNLALSLLEFLVSKTDSKTDKFLKNGKNLLDGFSKAVTLKTPFANLNMSEVDKNINKESFLERKEQFKKDFRSWEDKITTEDMSPDYSIVFIDDLDRCEPENILNLLSAMKLFFTYGKKTIFLCGIDKKAIREAVKTKYGEIVKANEYLEKIFDISFSMPDILNTSKLINQYFLEDKVIDEPLGDYIIDFFEFIRFRNPRRIKKVLNKYLIIKRLKENENSLNINLPNIVYKNSGSLFETYLTLYILILNEFEPNNFINLFNLSVKRVNYSNALLKSNLGEQRTKAVTSALFSYFRENSIFNNIKHYYQSGNRGKSLFINYMINFFPIEVDVINETPYNDINEFQRNFNVQKKSYEYYFTLFLYKKKTQTIRGLENMNYSLMDYKKMISNLI